MALHRSEFDSTYDPKSYLDSGSVERVALDLGSLRKRDGRAVLLDEFEGRVHLQTVSRISHVT